MNESIIEYSEPKWEDPSIRLQLCYCKESDIFWNYTECFVRPRPMRDKTENGILTEELLPIKDYWEAEVKRLREIHSLSESIFICKNFPLGSI